MRTRHQNKRCWLIGDASRHTPTLLTQFARLRGFEAQYCRGSESFPQPRAMSPALLAMSFADLDRMSTRERESCRASVSAGATLYIRGATAEGARYQLASLVDASIGIGRTPNPAACRFTHHPMIPSVLRGEESPLHEALVCVVENAGIAPEPMLVARDRKGLEFPIAFGWRAGRGAIICDLQPEDFDSETPLIWRLADPIARVAAASALIAVEQAAGREVDRPISFNLTIDDVPLPYDYFNEPMLEGFFAHVGSRHADFHLDCAWIPASHWISRRYIEILKHHDTGFVWHGMHRHVDHQKIDNPTAEMQAGKRAAAANAERYDIQLQPVLIFPFERADRRTEDLLLNEGFIAAAEQPRIDEGEPGMPAYLRFANVACTHQSGMRFLHRYEADFLTRDRMLALASLGMPILAFGHPKDVRLRRLSRFMERGGVFSHFDEVLDFASAKNLPGRSLEEIASECFEKKPESGELQCA